MNTPVTDAPRGAIGIGTELAGTYRIERLLGEGGMGLVYEAKHLRVPRRLAVKVLREATDEEQLARFRQEAEVASKLGHPNIVDVIDFNRLPSGIAYLVMEFLEGESLASRMRDRGPMDAAQVVPLLRQIASALHAAHCAGVVHRDLKPENVFLVPRERDGEMVDHVKVLDFGISKVHGSAVRTREDTVLGTPRYMAPEQAIGMNDEIDPRADQFALAVIAYEMVSGRVPFDSDNGTQVMFQIVYTDPPPLAPLAPNVPPKLVAAIERAMSKQPSDRFDDLSLFVEALGGRPLATTDRTRYPVLSAARVPGRSKGDAETARLTPVSRRSEESDTLAESRREAPTAVVKPKSKTDPKSDRTVATKARSGDRRWIGIGLLLLVGVAIAGFFVVGPKRATSQPPSDSAVTVVDPPSGGRSGSASAAPHPIPAENPPADASVAAPDDAPPAVDAAAPGRAGKPPTGAKPRTLPPEIAAQLKEAEAALAAGNRSDADRIARLVLQQDSREAYERAYRVLVVLACQNHDLGGAQGWMRNLPRSTWPSLRARCEKSGFTLTDP